MLLNTKKVIGCAVHAVDGNIGEIKAYYFDTREWIVRYFAVETGGWLNGRQVLIPPASFSPRDSSWKTVEINLTKEQIRNSPDVNFDLPLSRATETELVDYYRLPRYWEPVGKTYFKAQGAPSGGGQERSVLLKENESAVIAEPSGVMVSATAVPRARYLFSSKDIFTYRVRTVHDNVGTLEDFIADDYTWTLRYAVLDTPSFLPGKRVLLSPQWIDTIDDNESTVKVLLTKEAIMNSPSYDPHRSIEANYERNLFTYFERYISATPYVRWSYDHMRHTMPQGKILRIELLAPAKVHWSADEWKTTSETDTKENARGMHICELSTQNMSSGASVHFTFFWPLANHWEGKNYSVKVESPSHLVLSQ